MLKVIEEVGEVVAALARNNENDLRDGIGDVVVTLIILAMQNNMDLYECVNQAYSEIKNRQGKMVNGAFVKEADLYGLRWKRCELFYQLNQNRKVARGLQDVGIMSKPMKIAL